MRTTIDAAGRVVVPKALRDRAGLVAGQEIEITERDGRLEIEPASAAIRLERVAGRLVAVSDDDVPPLSDDVVRATLERVRR